MRAPPWTLDEFELVLLHPDYPLEELVRRLVRRSEGAVKVVRAGIHAYHLGKENIFLSQMMIERLEQGVESLHCGLCGNRFIPSETRSQFSNSHGV